jgi:hypothetical protein
MIENGSLTFWYSGGYREDENMLLTQRGLLGAQSLYAHEAIRLAYETGRRDDPPVGKHKASIQLQALWLSRAHFRLGSFFLSIHKRFPNYNFKYESILCNIILDKN